MRRWPLGYHPGRKGKGFGGGHLERHHISTACSAFEFRLLPGGFGEQATRDLERLRSCHRWTNLSPAGSGGVGGTTIPLDRERLAARLGFDGPLAHIRDGMWSAVILIDAGVASMQAALTVDRLAEDLEISASPQFGYVRLAGSSSRASVLLPQKRNPYALAVLRGGAGTLIGKAVGLMATQRTPSARTDNWLYADGEVIGAVETATRLVKLGEEVLSTMEVDLDALAESAGAHFAMATDLTELVVLSQGMDYRSAYRIVSRAVAEAAGSGRQWPAVGDLARAAQELGIDDLGANLDESLAGLGSPRELLSGREALGSCAPLRVEEHCRSVEKRVAQSREWSAGVSSRADSALTRLLADASTMAKE